MNEAMLEQTSPEYTFSVEAPDDCVVEFTTNDKYMAVVSEHSLDIYEIPVDSRDETVLHDRESSNMSINNVEEIQVSLHLNQGN